MATFISDTFSDTAGHTLESHAVAVGGPWVPASLPTPATGKFIFTTSPNGTRVRTIDSADYGYAYMATSPAPGDGQCDITFDAYSIDGGAIGALKSDQIGVVIGSSTTVPQVAVCWSRGNTAFRIITFAGDGTWTPLATTPTSFADSAWLNVHDNNLALSLRNNGGHPRYILTHGVVTVIDYTDATTLFSSLGKYRGLFIDGTGSYAGGSTDTKGFAFTSTFTAADYVAVACTQSQATVGLSVAITLTGTNTAWATSADVSVTGGSGASLSSVVVVSPTSITATLNPGSVAGTLHVTDVASGQYAAVTVNNIGLVLTAPSPAEVITGVNSADFVLAITQGAVPPQDVAITIDDNGALGTFSGGADNSGQTIIVLGANTTSARFTYKAPANPQGTPRQNLTIRASGTNYTSVQVGVVAITAAGNILLTGPNTSIAGQATAPFTASLPALYGIQGTGHVFWTDFGAGGRFASPLGTLTTDSPSTTTTYIPPAGANTVGIGLTNDAGLSDPPTWTLAVSTQAQYTVTGDTNGALNTPSYPFSVTSLGTPPSGDTQVTLSDGGVSGTNNSHGSFSVNPVHFTHNPSDPGSDVLLAQTVYTPPVGYTGQIAITATNNRSLIDPAGWPYVVYDPATHGPRDFLAPYGPSASGQASTLGLTVYDPGGQVLLAHTAAFTVEDGSAGVYRQSRVLALADHGEGIWDVPTGFSPPGYTQTYDALTPITGVLSQSDKDAILAILNTRWVPPTDITQASKDDSITNRIEAIYQALHGAGAQTAQVPATGSTPAVPGTFTRKNRAGDVYNTQSVLDDGATLSIGAVS